MDVRTYEEGTSSGEIVVPQGSTAQEHRGIFLVLEGHLGEWREPVGSGAQPVLIRPLYPGSIFGDAVLHSDAPNSRVVDGAFINSVPVSILITQRANLIVATNVLSTPPDEKERDGTSTTADPSSTFYRGALAQGTPINFSSRFDDLYDLVLDLHANPSVNGTTRLEPWGGVFLEGTDPHFNSFKVSASAFSNAVYRSISAPAGSVVMVTLEDYIGSTFTLANTGITYQGVDPHSVLFHFWGATTINLSNLVLQGTILAPWADVQFDNGRFEGGIYARSLSGNAEGHLHPLPAFTFCGARPR